VQGYLREKAYLSVVKEYDAEKGMAKCIQRNKFCVGDAVELISPGMTGRRFIAEEMYNDQHEVWAHIIYNGREGYLMSKFLDIMTQTASDAYAAGSTPAPTYTPLTRGDKSDAVLDMQNRLYQLGYLLDDRDGSYGSKTQTAVKRFQTDAGLEVTGIADSATLELLYSEEAPMTEYAQTTRPEPAATPDPTAAE
jgi:hypothetical protein